MRILPKSVDLVDWEENFDLRYLRRNAYKLAKKHNLKTGQALLVSGSRYKGARRFQFLIVTDAGPMVLSPQTGNRNLMLTLMLRVAESASLHFE